MELIAMRKHHRLNPENEERWNLMVIIRSIYVSFSRKLLCLLFVDTIAVKIGCWIITLPVSCNC